MSEFKPGDRVRCVNDAEQWGDLLKVEKDRIYTIESVLDERVKLVGLDRMLYLSRFEPWTDTVMIQVDRKTELERIETAHGHMIDSMCSIIRRYADEYNLNFCNDGLESFCNEVGIVFTTADVKRRAVIYLDLAPAPFEDQKAALLELLPTSDHVKWRQAYIDSDNEGEESEWSSHPLTENAEGLRLLQ